jgi:thiol-disulfide isomerase/thioredoxin
VAVSVARPVVRNVRTNDEFKKLLKHHAENTGLPVVVDFYSDGCGPCR